MPPRPETHGSAIRVWDKIVEPEDDGLRTAAGIILENVGTYVNVNNYYEGYAPLTIRRLVGMLE